MDFKEALCVKTPENYWLSEVPGDQAQAKILCARCPVLPDCTVYALEVRPSCGVWATQVIGGYVE